MTAVRGACTATGLALLTPTALPPVEVVLLLPEGALRVPLDFIELPVSFDRPSVGVGALAVEGEALLTVAVGLLAGFAGTATAGSTDFLFALVTASGTFLPPFADVVGILDREPEAIDNALVATFAVGLTTAAWGLARFAVLTTLAIARVADFTIPRTEDFLPTGKRLQPCPLRRT